MKTLAAGHRPHPKNLNILSAHAACHFSRPRDPAGSSCIVEMVSAVKWTWCRWGSGRGKPGQLHQVEFTAEFIVSSQRKQEGKQAGRKENANENT